MCRRVFDANVLLRPWFDRLAEDVPGLALFDAHTHVGANDPDGFRQTIDELLAVLAPVESRALVFPMHEPDGYREANDMVLDRVAATNGTLRALCRVQPKDPGPSRRRGAASTPARPASSCTRARSSSRSPSPRCATSSPPRTSAAARS